MLAPTLSPPNTLGGGMPSRPSPCYLCARDNKYSIRCKTPSHLDAFNRIGSCCIHTTTHTPERKSPSWRGGDVQLAVKNASLYGWEWVGTRQQTGVEMVRNQIGSSTARARRASA